MKIVKIGKSRSNDIYKDFVNDSTVSRFHCQIFVDNEGNAFLTDLESTNGTFVNGNKIIKPVKLDSLDIVRAGNSLVKWKEHLMGRNVSPPSSKDNYNQDTALFIFLTNYWWLFVIIFILIIICAVVFAASINANNYIRFNY